MKQKDFDLDQLDKRVSDDLLVLSGIIDADEFDATLYVDSDQTTPMIEILSGIKKSGLFPEELRIEFSNKKFCVNNAPTNIDEFDVMCLYNGLSSFTSPDKAVNKVVDIICRRMQPLFGLKNK